MAELDVVVKTYRRGIFNSAQRKFKVDAKRMAAKGYEPTTQATAGFNAFFTSPHERITVTYRKMA